MVFGPAPATRQGGWQAFGLWAHRHGWALESLKGNFSRTSIRICVFLCCSRVDYGSGCCEIWGRSHHSVVGLFESSCGATLSYIHVCSRSVVLWHKFQLKHAQVTLKVILACICLLQGNKKANKKKNSSNFKKLHSRIEVQELCALVVPREGYIGCLNILSLSVSLEKSLNFFPLVFLVIRKTHQKSLKFNR